ncbi:MAG: UDP-N-acetylglucosamine 1-carboxyvinyltransferase [Gemmatimonadota bacterium]|nr:MAG: UDP-N-acetylglucosamine 1-carboxyvinyltransferase [Gemmatimonadota bacterium]
MDAFRIIGGNKLQGTVTISGAKNAALPIMVATLLTSGKSVLRNVPNLRDVATMSKMLRLLGAQVTFEKNVLTVDTSKVNKWEAPYELVKTMRASVYVLGPLLARFGQARVSLPGGCAWGPRPVDLHIKGMQKLGAEVDVEHGYIVARAKRLKGAHIYFDISSVGATGNIMMAATLARGTTRIENAAREPDIVALAFFLRKMGARIEGEGTDTIEIEGVDNLSPQEEEIIPDRIEAGTFMGAAAITGGEVILENCIPEHVNAFTEKLRESGVQIEEGENSMRVKTSRGLQPVHVTTAPYPGFPTDLQAQMMSLLSIAEGTSVITETIFTDRFNHAPELQRLGADITVDENVAVITGVEKLSGAPVMATDIRASAALVLAGLVAEGETTISRVYHIDRGYERIEEKLSSLGANIERMREA